MDNFKLAVEKRLQEQQKAAPAQPSVANFESKPISVETLASAPSGAADSNRELSISLDSISIRRQARSDFSHVPALADSIREAGLLQPIVVEEAAGRPGYYELLVGESRYRAYRLLQEKYGDEYASIPARVMSARDGAARVIAQFIENGQRASYRPLEEASLFRELRDAFGLTQADIARSVGRSEARISSMSKLLSEPEAVQVALREGALTAKDVIEKKSAAWEEFEKAHPELYNQAVEEGADPASEAAKEEKKPREQTVSINLAAARDVYKIFGWITQLLADRGIEVAPVAIGKEITRRDVKAVIDTRAAEILNLLQGRSNGRDERTE